MPNSKHGLRKSPSECSSLSQHEFYWSRGATSDWSVSFLIAVAVPDITGEGKSCLVVSGGHGRAEEFIW